MKLAELEKQIEQAQGQLIEAENKLADAQSQYEAAVDSGNLEQARKHKAELQSAESDVSMLRDRIKALESKRAESQRLEAKPLFQKAVKRFEAARKAEADAHNEFVALVDQLADLRERLQPIHREARFAAIAYRESAVLAGEDSTLPGRDRMDPRKIEALFRLAREYSNLFTYRNHEAGQVSSMTIKPRDFSTAMQRIKEAV